MFIILANNLRSEGWKMLDVTGKRDERVNLGQFGDKQPGCSSKEEYEEPERKRTKYVQQQHQESRASDSKQEESFMWMDVDECICEDVSRKVVCVNMCSVNPRNKTTSMQEKLKRLTTLLTMESPWIVAIVETWLNSTHANDKVIECLNLEGYEVIRHDREQGHHPDNAYGDEKSDVAGKRGGGIMLAWKNVPGFQVTRNIAEDYADSIVNFEISWKFQCCPCNEYGNQNLAKNEKTFGFTIVYRRPGTTQQKILDRLVHLPSWFESEYSGYSEWCMVGDFNWLPNSQDLKDVLYFVKDTATIFEMPTTHKGGNTLDYVSKQHLSSETNIVEYRSPVRIFQ